MINADFADYLRNLMAFMDAGRNYDHTALTLSPASPFSEVNSAELSFGNFSLGDMPPFSFCCAGEVYFGQHSTAFLLTSP